MAPRFKPYPRDYYQSQLFPANVFELLPKDHECFLYRELFEQLDTSEVEAQYSERGQRAYPPHQIVSILIYAYSHGVFSSRQIEKRCREDLGFLYIAGRNCPNFRMLSDFRKDHGEFFRACFKQTVQMAMGLGLVTLGHVSLDGSKFQANSSKHKAMSYGRLKQREQQLSEEIEALIGEPVFGQIKNSGFRGFGLRGKEKVAGEFSWVCVAHNLKKIMLAALRGEVCPEFGKRAAWA